MRKRQLLWVVLILVSLTLAVAVVCLRCARSHVTLAISCTPGQYKLGDEIPITLTLTNNGRRPFPDRGVWLERLPYIGELFWGNRPITISPLGEYRLVLKGPAGLVLLSAAPPFPESWSSSRSIKPGQAGTETTVLNDWVLISEPGIYTAKAIFEHLVEPPNKADRVAFSCKSEELQVTIEPRTDNEMEAYIKELLEKLREADSEQEEQWLITKLAYTRDNRIIPTLLEFAYADKQSYRVKRAIRYHLPLNEEVKELLLHGVRHRGLPDIDWLSILLRMGFSDEEVRDVIATSLSSKEPHIVSAGAWAARIFGDDSHMRRLIELAVGDTKAKLDAISAIAWHRTDEGVEALRNLIHDPNEVTRWTAREAIKYALRYREWPEEGPRSREYVAELIRAIRRTNSRERWIAITEICTASKGVIEAGKALIEDPDKEINTTGTDKILVEAIRELLKDPDTAVRELAISSIRLAPRGYCGRPLRPEDFPSIYAECFKETRRENK